MLAFDSFSFSTVFFQTVNPASGSPAKSAHTETFAVPSSKVYRIVPHRSPRPQKTPTQNSAIPKLCRITERQRRRRGHFFREGEKHASILWSMLVQRREWGGGAHRSCNRWPALQKPRPNLKPRSVCTLGCAHPMPSVNHSKSLVTQTGQLGCVMASLRVWAVTQTLAPSAGQRLAGCVVPPTQGMVADNSPPHTNWGMRGIPSQHSPPVNGKEISQKSQDFEE